MISITNLSGLVYLYKLAKTINLLSLLIKGKLYEKEGGRIII